MSYATVFSIIVSCVYKSLASVCWLKTVAKQKEYPYFVESSAVMMETKAIQCSLYWKQLTC